jgi:hypothetical protein
MAVTRAGYLAFIRQTMGINTTVLPDNSPDIDTSLALAQEIVNPVIDCVSPRIFDWATYNLAGDYLINIAQDQSGQTFFADLRKEWNINGFVGGVVQNTYDETTGESMAMPEFIKDLTFSDLQNLKTPYGRQYLAIAQKWGTNWGLS